MKKSRPSCDGLDIWTLQQNASFTGCNWETLVKKKQDKKPEVKLTGLDQLGEAVRGLELAVPTMEEINLDGLDGDIEATTKAMAKVRAGVNNAIMFIRSADAKLAKYAGDRDKIRIARAQVTVGVEKARAYLDEVFGLKNVFLRQAGAFEYIKATLGAEYGTRDEAFTAMHCIVDRGIIVLGRNGPIIFSHQHYVVPESWGFETQDIEEITEAVAQFSRRTMALEKAYRQEMILVLQKKAQITIEQAQAGENGRCLMEVPAESFLDKYGAAQWRAGGQLLCLFGDEEVTPMQAVGAIEGLIDDMVAGEVKLQRYTLEWDSPPGTGTQGFERVCVAVMRSMGLDRSDAELYVRREQTLWHMIKRAAKAVSLKIEMEQARIELKAGATITPEQLFGLNGEGGPVAGTALLEFPGVFRVDRNHGETIDGLFFLASASKGDDGWMVEVVRVPKHLDKLMKQFAGTKFPAADDFVSLPDPMGRIFRAIKGKCETNHAIAREEVVPA